jgi:hypothetical protein
VVIINLGGDGYFIESDKGSDYGFINWKHSCRPQNFPKGIDSTHPFKNYKDVRYQDRHGQETTEMVSMVDFSARIPNCSQNILLLLEVAHFKSRTYSDNKEENRDY